MDIPWARSGVSPSGVTEMNLELTANHHSIPKWLKHDLKDKIEKEIYSSFLEESHIFNLNAIKKLWRTWTKEPDNVIWNADRVVALCSLAISIKSFNIKTDYDSLKFPNRLATRIRSERDAAKSFIKRLLTSSGKQ